jgi:DNA (cytosine-5)-methyltransferase 1
VLKATSDDEVFAATDGLQRAGLVISPAPTSDLEFNDHQDASIKPRIAPIYGIDASNTRRTDNSYQNTSESVADVEDSGHQFLAQQLFFDQTPIDEDREFNPEITKERAVAIINPPELIYPKSQYQGYVPPLPESKERHACQELRRVSEQHRDANAGHAPTKDDYVEFGLTDFSIYLPQNQHTSYELRGLQNLASKVAHSCLLFDGILNCGDVRHYVQGIPFKICPIGNYGEEFHHVGDAIWVQSLLNAHSNVYYRLQKPSQEYSRFHKDFLWLANFAKHFVDYSLACQAEKREVSIHNFRAHFIKWCKKLHADSPHFQTWCLEYGRDDFRVAVAANVNFLFKESIGVSEGLRSLRIWKETIEKSSIEAHPIQEKMTVVTPYVFECFSHLKFGHHLKAIVPDISGGVGGEMPGLSPRAKRFSIDANKNAEMEQHPTPSASKSLGREKASTRVTELAKMRHRMAKEIKPGDVVAVTKDGPDSVWKDEVSRWKQDDNRWYLYIQAKHKNSGGKYTFDGIWLYKPSDTSCAKMKYPYAKELFLSDNCTCLSGRISQDELIEIIPVVWHGQPSEADIFIRQTYLNNDRFVTLKEEHKTCEHLGHLRPKAGDFTAPPTIAERFPVGQTVLALPVRKSSYGLEPYEVLKYSQKGSKQYVTLRQLLRMSELDTKGSHQPNELVYTERTEEIAPTRIDRTCLVRFYTEEEELTNKIPPPYSRGGTASAFFITKRLQETSGELTPIEEDQPQSLIQGFDPHAQPPRKLLAGLDLYCGGGNFGRGLEEGGALLNKWAVDISAPAVSTYAANLKKPGETSIFFGSVNDLLAQAFKGNPKNLDIPLPGDVDVISAGSPCQGFSLLNPSKNQEQGLKNQSLVASVAAYIDFYRPRYGLLENVLTMAQKGTGRDEDVLSQLVCAIVGLGYQLQLFLLDAWSFGSPQSRSRIFVSFAAPGYVPLEHPDPSHSHPSNIRDRGLGKLANGESFGRRVHCATPFKYRTAGEATADLPVIADGATQHCTSHPDHVQSPNLSKLHKAQLSCIPTHPRGMNFVKTWKGGQGVMTKVERNLFPFHTKSGTLRHAVRPESKAWGRVNPNGLFATVVVVNGIEDARMGTFIHWDQHRRITLLEQRRAQSFPDEEVLIGIRSEQVKIVGNSVARSVSMALGISLRKAWLENPEKDNPGGRITATSPSSQTRRAPVMTLDQPLNASKTRPMVVLLSLPNAAPHSSNRDPGEPSSSDEISNHHGTIRSSNKRRRSTTDEDYSRKDYVDAKFTKSCYGPICCKHELRCTEFTTCVQVGGSID